MSEHTPQSRTGSVLTPQAVRELRATVRTGPQAAPAATGLVVGAMSETTGVAKAIEAATSSPQPDPPSGVVLTTDGPAPPQPAATIPPTNADASGERGFAASPLAANARPDAATIAAVQPGATVAPPPAPAAPPIGAGGPAASLPDAADTPPSPAAAGAALTATPEPERTPDRAAAAAPEPAAAAAPPATRVSGDAETAAEDATVPLDIAVDNAGPDTTLLLSGLPPGARLSAGTANPDGSWTLTVVDLAGLALLPAPHWSGEVTLNVRVSSPDGDPDAVAIPVRVTAVADQPLLAARAADTAEDTSVALDIAAALVDTDGSEALAIRIEGLPAGATLTAGVPQPDGAWLLTHVDLAGLRVIPPPDLSGEFALRIVATATEAAGGSATRTADLTLTIAPRAEADARLTATGAGAEDQWIGIEVAFDTPDTDGSERLADATLIEGVPAGAMLNRGTELSPGTWSVPTDALLAGEVAIRPPADSDATLRLTVTATLEDRAGAATDSRPLVALAEIVVSAVADLPAARARDATGAEETAIALDLAAGLGDVDGSEILTVAILGVPEGATLSAGSRQSDGSWAVAPADLDTLTLTPPADFAGTLELTLRATATETVGGDTAIRDRRFTIEVAPRAEADARFAAGGDGAEDSWIPVVANFTTPDADGSERLAETTRIEGVPPGATLNAGVEDAPGRWSVPTADLLAGRIAIRPPADTDADLRLTLTTTLEDRAGEALDTRPLVAVADIRVAAVADAPTPAARDATGAEDTAIALDLAAALGDVDGSETLSVAILGVPEGATLSAGSRQLDGSWAVAPADLAALTLTPPRDFAGTIALTLRATATEADGGDAATREVAFAVEVAAVADVASLTAGAAGREDTAIAIDARFGNSPDASEAWATTALIRGVPAGATLSQGTDLGAGVWRVEQAELAAGRIAITPPADSDAAIPLTIEARIIDREGTGAERAVTTTLTVAVAGVADAPTARAADAAGVEDTAIRLDLAAALTDLDRSETLTVAIIGVPEGATLSAGARQSDGSWAVAPSALAGLTLTPPADFAGSIGLTLRATTTEAAGGDTATRDIPFAVTVEARADAARINVAGDGAEDSWIAIRGTLATTDRDGSEQLGPDITIRGVPSGAALSHGTEITPGTWSVPRTVFDSGSLAIRPPANADADITLRIAVQSRDGASVTTTEATATIVVRAVADAPTVQVADARGTEDSRIRLAGLGGALTDTDGSEALGFVLSGVPATATLSAGTKNADGTWSLSPAQLSTVSITPPAHFSGSMNLSLTAVATEARDGAAPARSTAQFTVAVDPAADAGTISGSVTGNEDGAIVVKPSFATPDKDGSETWSAISRVSGVPAGATLSRGTQVSAGVWDVATDDLRAGLISVRPPADSDADFNLTVRATLSDTGNGMTVSREITGTHRITVKAVADAPVVTVADAAGAEDQPIALNLAARLTDTDGSERLGLVLAGVPAGATLSAGSRNADGTWTVPTESLATLAITPPRDFSGTMNLTLRATASDNDSKTATTSVGFAVRVEAVADAPTIRVGPGAGREDSAIALRVSGATTDIDGSERVVGFRLLDVPDGATVRAGGAVLARAEDGSFAVDATAAPTLTITPPINSDVDFTLRVSAISAEPNGSRAESVAVAVPIRVDAVADAPVWIRVGAAGAEDSAIPLNLAASLPDGDGSEQLSFVISGLPPGAVLSAGTYRGPGSWSLTAAEAAVATIVPPRDFAGTMNLTATAVAQERDGGHQAVTTVNFPVRVTAVVDTGAWSASAAGPEDAPIALNLAPPLRDGDGSERVVGTVLVTGVPDGATLRLADGSRVAPDDTGTYRIAPERLGGVTLTMPADSDVAARLTVTATIEDTGGVRSEVRGSVTVDPHGVADTPSLVVTDIVMPGHGSGAPLEGWGKLPVAATPTDTDGSESVHVWVRDVPAGFTLSSGTPAGEGAWLLRADDLPSLQIRPPAGYAGETTLRVEAVAVEREGDTERVTTKLTVRVEPDSGGGGGGGDPTGDAPPRAQAPALALDAAPGREDAPSALTIKAATQDSDRGDELLGIRIAGVPAGGRLSAGIHDPERDVWVLRPDELERLQVIPPADFAGEIALSVTAVAVERTGDVATTTERVTLGFEAVADAPSIAAAPPAGFEDRPVPLNLGIAATDADGSERVVGVLLSGLPRGATIAPADGVTDNGDGTWSVRPDALGSVALVPPPHAHGTVSVTVTATVQETSNGATATVSRGVSVSFAAVPDAPVAAATDVTGREDSPIALGLSASLADTDGSELLSIVVSGFPAGAQLSAGINNGDGSFTLTPPQLAGLTVTPPANWSGGMALTMRANALERSTGEVATTDVAFRVAVTGVADALLVDPSAAARGAEDRPIAIDIVARLTDTDGSETAYLVVTGVPAGASFSAGAVNPDGSWTIPGAGLAGLTFTAPPHYAGTLRFDFAATARETDGDAAVTRFTTAVTVDPVADAPVLAFTGIVGAEDTPVRLPLAATLTDTDGSESLARFVVSGLPSGATLSAGTRGSDGAWTLTPEQAANVTMTPPAHWSGTASLTVTAVSREAATGEEASSRATLPVSITPVADAATLTAANATGTEDASVALNLAAALTDTSEQFAAILVTGLPPGFALSAGTPTDAGAWSLPPAQLSGLRMTPPADWNGTVNLTLHATTRDGDSTATASRGFAVTIAPVNDAPALALAGGPEAATGQASAAVLTDAAITDIDSARMGGATVTLAGGGADDRLVFAGFALREEGGRTLLGDTGIQVTTGQDNTVTLAGAAPAATYERVLESLTLENTGGGLEAGTRSIGVTLRDEAGAAAGRQLVALRVEPSLIEGSADDAVLAGTSGHDTFIGGAGDETMQGGDGADLFVAAMGGGNDRVEGGGGSWIDTLKIEGAGAPGAGGWTLVLDDNPNFTEGDRSYDFAEPVSGHVQFADGTQVELLQIERITW